MTKTRSIAATAAGFILLFAHAAVAQTAEIHVFASNGVKAVIDDLKAKSEHALGVSLAIQFGTTAGLKQRIEAGEAFDVALLTADAIDDAIKAGKIAGATRADLARCGIGVGIRAGAAKPDIGSPEAFKKTLLNSKSVTWASDGASRVYIAQMLDHLGIAEDMKPKIRLQPGSVRAAASVADGEAEILMTLISEILPAPGVELLGPLPAKLQNYVSFATGVSVQAKNPQAGKALIKFLTGPKVASVYKAKGMEPR